MLNRQAMRLLGSVVVALSGLLVFGTVSQANPITVRVTGDVFAYESYRYNFATQTYDYNFVGGSGSVSGTFSWDPALMGRDHSQPPKESLHGDGYEGPPPTPWLTSSLTVVTPDFTRTYDPATSAGLPYPGAALYAAFPNPSYGTYSEMTAQAGYYDLEGHQAYNKFAFIDYTTRTPILGYRDGQFVPVDVHFNAECCLTGYYDGELIVVEQLWDPRDRNYTQTGVQAHLTGANLTSATTIPEPGTVALVGAGLVGLVAQRRRSQRSSVPSVRWMAL